MPRVIGIDIPDNKSLEISLTYLLWDWSAFVQ